MAHIRSILPQRNGVAPVDNNTKALFHYDEHTKDTVGGVSPIGEKVSKFFSGTEYVEVAHHSDLNATSGLTICFWLYHSTDGGWSPFIGKDDSTANGCNYRLWVGAGDRIMDFIGLNRAYASFDLSTVLNYNTWQHITFTHDGAKASFYVDGELIGTVDHLLGPSNTAPLLIGKDPTTAYGKGGISDIRLFNRPLSSGEVIQQMSGTPSNDGSLLGWWKLNEEESLIAYDYSGNGHDGVINGELQNIQGLASYSLVKDGFPGGAIKAQEATENLLNSDLTTWTPYNTASVVDNGTHYTLTAGSQNYGMYYRAGFNLEIDVVHTYSWYARYVSGATNMGAHTGPQNSTNFIRIDGGSWNAGDSIVIPQDGNWHRVEITFPPASGYTDDKLYMQIGRAGGGGGVYDIKNIQLEAKPYATGFTRGKRSERKSYGKGILLEGGTTNLAAASNYSVYAYATYDGEVYMENPDNRDAVHKYHRSSDTGAARGRKTLPAITGSTYAMSITMKVKDGLSVYMSPNKPNPESGNTMSTTILDRKDEDLGNGWFRYTRVYRIDSNTANECIFCYGISDGVIDDEFYVYDLQWESGSYATSFVDGSRSNAFLEYPIRVNTDNCTINFWAKCTRNRGFYLDIYPEVSGGANDRIFIRPETDFMSIGFGKIVNDGNYYSTFISMQDATEWRMYTLVCEETKTTLYQDGVKIGTKAAVSSGYSKTLSFARGPSSYKASSIIDELRIDECVRSESEIQAWYYQGRNGR